jgi:hypothetical protein
MVSAINKPIVIAVIINPVLLVKDNVVADETNSFDPVLVVIHFNYKQNYSRRIFRMYLKSTAVKNGFT